MTLIIGLGNPGENYQYTRHNIGFMTVDNLQLIIDKFSDWKNIKKLQAEISQGEIDNKKIILAKPQTFMNLSGKSIKKLIRNRASIYGSEGGKEGKSLFDYWKLEIRNLIVIHDDIDLPLGKIRIVKNRGAAGHKGVQSIIKELGTKNFIRLRIGIQPKFGKPKNPEKFVLQKFNKDEEKILKEVIKKTVEAIEMALKEGIEKAMTKFNKIYENKKPRSSLG